MKDKTSNIEDFSYKRASKMAIESETVKMHELVQGKDPDFVLGDRSYGKGGVKILHVVKNGENCD